MQTDDPPQGAKEEFGFDPGTKQPNLKKGVSDVKDLNENGVTTELISHYILEMKETQIQDVWDNNFEEELWKIMELVQTYNVIAMDTEFPGINTIPQGRIDEKDFEYQLIKENVRSQKIIQIGISIADEMGNVPDGVSTWQFNFKFNEDKDIISEDSKNLLKNAGIDFAKFQKEGLESQNFSELMIQSDIILNDNIIWVAFHGGFDFGYFLQMIYGQVVPDTTEQFYNILKLFFPTIYDLKYIIKDHDKLKDCGLQKLASELKVERIGPQHQAGSDSLLTLATYFKLKDQQFKISAGVFKEGEEIFKKGENIIYGLGKGFLGVKDKDYLWNYKMASLSNAEQYSSEMHMHYNYHPHQPNFFYMEPGPGFQGINHQQMGEYAPNQQIHGGQQYLHQQQQQYWNMMSHQYQHIGIPDDNLNQNQQGQNQHHQKENQGRKKYQNQF